MAKREKPLPQITRDRLQAGKAVSRLNLIEDLLATQYLRLGPEEIRALEAAAKIAMWKVNKCLPELKAIEHSGAVTADVVVRFNP